MTKKKKAYWNKKRKLPKKIILSLDPNIETDTMKPVDMNDVYKDRKLRDSKFKDLTKAAIDNMDLDDLVACLIYFNEMYEHTTEALKILRHKKTG